MYKLVNADAQKATMIELTFKAILSGKNHDEPDDSNIGALTHETQIEDLLDFTELFTGEITTAPSECQDMNHPYVELTLIYN